MWEGDNYNKQTILNTRYSTAYGVSDDKTIIAGFANIDQKGNRAVIWKKDGDEYTQTDLGSLRSDVYGNSHVYAITGDKRFIVGQGDSNKGNNRAGVWTGSDYSTKYDLGTLKSDNSGESLAYSISSDGATIVGQSVDDNKKNRAAVWYGSNYATKKNLGTLASDNSGESIASAISANGKFIVGQADNSRDKRATVWSEDSWSTKTDLGTLRSDNTGASAARAVNNDGSMIVGDSKDNSNADRATLWSGNGYSEKTDLGTLRSDNKQQSHAYTITPDGSVAAGEAYNDDGNTHTVIWKIKKQNNSSTSGNGGSSSGSDNGSTSGNGGSSNGNDNGSTSGNGGNSSSNNNGSSNSENNSDRNVGNGVNGNNSGNSSNSSGVTSEIYDVTATRKILAAMGGDTLAMMDTQRMALSELQRGSAAQKQGDFVYDAKAGMLTSNANHDASAELSMSYGLRDDVAAGLAIHHAFNHKFRNQRKNDNFGGGAFLEWHNFYNGPDRIYARAMVAASRYSTEIHRPVLPHTEAGIGNTHVDGYSYALEAGQHIFNNENMQLGWYGGIRYTRLNRKGYTERDAEFPVTFSDAKLNATSAYIGAQYTLPLTNALGWVSNIEVERDLNTPSFEYSAKVPYMGAVVMNDDIARTRGSLSTGVVFHISQAADLFVMPSLTRTVQGDYNGGGSITLSGKF